MRLIVLCAAALTRRGRRRREPPRPCAAPVRRVARAPGRRTGLAAARPRMLALVTCAGALGGLRASLVAADAVSALDPYIGQTVRLEGVTVQPPSMGPAAVTVLVDTRGVGPPGRDPPPLHAASGAARVRVVGDPAALDALTPGEALVLEGRLLASDTPGPPTLLFPQLLGREPPSTFEPSTVLDRLRAAAQAGIRRYLPEPQASLSAGVLLGGSGRLDADFRLQLQRSGLAHVVAIDGFKQVVVAAVLGAVAVRVLGPRPGSGAGPAWHRGLHAADRRPSGRGRAALMVGLAILAARTGRLADSLTSVVVAATLMAAVEPRILLDVGLQLSLSATLGIVLLWPRLRPRLKGVPRLIAEPAGLTLAVTLATLPITLGVFQLVSLVSPVAHILAVPLLPLVLVSAAVLALVSPIPARGRRGRLGRLAAQHAAGQGSSSSSAICPGRRFQPVACRQLPRVAWLAPCSSGVCGACPKRPGCAGACARRVLGHRRSQPVAARCLPGVLPGGGGAAADDPTRRSTPRAAPGGRPRRGGLHSRADRAHRACRWWPPRRGATGQPGGRPSGGLGAPPRQRPATRPRGAGRPWPDPGPLSARAAARCDRRCQRRPGRRGGARRGPA